MKIIASLIWLAIGYYASTQLRCTGLAIIVHSIWMVVTGGIFGYNFYKDSDQNKTMKGLSDVSDSLKDLVDDVKKRNDDNTSL